MLGSAASLAAQAVTTPLDVVRTRVMTASPDEEYEGGIECSLSSVVVMASSAFFAVILRVWYITPVVVAGGAAPHAGQSQPFRKDVATHRINHHVHTALWRVAARLYSTPNRSSSLFQLTLPLAQEVSQMRLGPLGERRDLKLFGQGLPLAWRDQF